MVRSLRGGTTRTGKNGPSLGRRNGVGLALGFCPALISGRPSVPSIWAHSRYAALDAYAPSVTYKARWVNVRPNAVKNMIAEGRPVLNAWLSIASSHVAEGIAHQGVDSVTIDLQHGAIDFAAAFHMLQAISTSPAVPFARVPAHDAAMMGKLLDAGAYGLICPMVENRTQAEAFVTACRYPPRGTRSFGPNRVTYYAGRDYWQHADAEILLLAQVETRTAIDNLDSIVAVPGLDGIYIGPADLSLSYGAAPAMVPKDASIEAAIKTACERARRADLVAAIHTDGPATVRQRFAEGFHMCSFPTDMRFLLDAVRAAVKEARA